MGTLDHGAALEWAQQWRGVDVILIDAADERLSGDHFPGVKVVRHIRACQGDARPVIVVVTGHFLNDGLRHRMRDADADFFFLRSDLHTVAALRDVVLHPEHYRRGVPAVTDPGVLRALGMDEHSDVEGLLAYVERHGLERALDPSFPCRDDPRSRRWARHRKAVTETARIRAVNLTTGGPPRGNQRWPSLRQLRRVYQWAAKIRSVDRDSPPGS